MEKCPRAIKKTIDFERINDLKESLKGGSDSLKKKKLAKICVNSDMTPTMMM